MAHHHAAVPFALHPFHEAMMKPVPLAASLYLLVLLSACGDATPPGGEPASQAASGGPNPADILAALPPVAQPYGLDVYTGKCLNCHGNLGQGIDTNPALKGLTRTAMYRKLLDYRSGKIQGERTAVMAKAVAGLSDGELAAVSIYAGE
jgi:cytochrome c553